MLSFTQAPFADDYDVDNWPRWCADHCDIDKVRLQGNQTVNTILDHAPIIGDHDMVVVDVRTQYLRVGDFTLTPGWHEDTTEDPTAIHHLYIVGDNRTAFLEKSFPKNHYVTYDSYELHQAIEVHTEEFRLFIRLQECNKFLSGWSKTDLTEFYPYIFPKEWKGDPIYVSKEEYDGFFD